MEYLLLVYTDDALHQALPEAEYDARMRTCFEHADGLKRQGKLKAYRQLEQPSTGKSVRIRYAGFLTCLRKEGDAIICKWSPPSAELKVKGTIHWVSAKHAVAAEVRLYDRLFTVENPMAEEGHDYKEFLNPHSLDVITGYVEPSLIDVNALAHFQFERIGYFNADPDSKPGKPVFNRTVTLKDSWAKTQKKE